MRSYSRDLPKTYLKSASPVAKALSTPKPAQKLLKPNQVLIGKYKYNSDEILGKGFTSRVYKGVQVDNIYKRYAIKVIELKKFRGSSLEMLQAEIEIHRQLVHENVLRLFEIIKTPYFYYLVLEYCPHGNLHQYIRQKRQLTQANAIEIMGQILEGYSYLAGQNVMHRDLKPANILRIGNKWKISDFGFAVKSKYGFKDRINVGTPLYMAPQTIFKTYYSSKTDIFSLGVIMYQMVVGRTPWESSNEKELKEKLKNELVMPEWIRNGHIRELIGKCCQLNETKRMAKQELATFKFTIQEGGTEKQPSQQGKPIHGHNPKGKQEQKTQALLPPNPQEELFKQNYEKMELEFHFAQQLYTCVRNKDSFLFSGQVSHVFSLTAFKFSLKLLRLLADRKVNHFELKQWQQFNKTSKFQLFITSALVVVQKQQKQYLQSIKNFDIKTVRTVNRRFPELCSSAPLGQHFYQSLKFFLVPLIRQHNHELMLLLKKNEQAKHKLGNIFGQGGTQLNFRIQAMDALFTVYNIADLRTNNSASTQEIALSAMKVVENYRNSSLSEEDYVDMRRLIRSI